VEKRRSGMEELAGKQKQKRGNRADVKANQFNDLGNARRLVGEHGDDIRFNYAITEWFHWNSNRFKQDALGTVERYAKQTVETMLVEAAGVIVDGQGTGDMGSEEPFPEGNPSDDRAGEVGARNRH
jgi:hypothetical protein